MGHKKTPSMPAVGLLLGAALLGLAGQAATEGPDVDITADVIYGHKAGMALTFDVFTPKSDRNGAAVLFMVSGGWYSVWRPPEDRAPRFRSLLEKGFTVFAVHHGSSPRFNLPEVVEDVRRAVRFIRFHAEDYGIDEARMGVWGGSAGGHLSLMLGTASDKGRPGAEDEILQTGDRVAAVVAFYPPVDVRGSNMWALRAGESNPRLDRYRPALTFDTSLSPSVSPLLHVSPDDPPTLLVHGDADTLVPVTTSKTIHAEFKKFRVETELVVIEGGGHGFREPAHRARANEAMVDWFVKHLAGP